MSLLLSALMNSINLGIIDRILGALFSTIVALLLVVGVTNAANSIMPELELFSRTTQKQSLLYNKVQDMTLSLLGEVKKEIDEKTE